MQFNDLPEVVFQVDSVSFTLNERMKLKML